MIKYKYKCKFQTECHWPLSFAKIGGIGNCWTAGCYARWTRLARYFCRLAYSAERCGAPPCGEDVQRIVSSLIEAGKWELYRLRKCALFVRRGKARRSTYKQVQQRKTQWYLQISAPASTGCAVTRRTYMNPACWLRICALIDQHRDRDVGEHCAVC